jgi:LmbE family N-acetylglucosaminyl deacetylase
MHNVWFLDGRGSTSQNVLLSLSSLKHGQALEQAVRLVRLTRPEVILTFMPALVGDHGDHQAAGVIATEAFDLAGDASAFPSQLAAPRRIYFETLLEGLRPWQPKKIYYFTDSRWLDLREKAAEYSNQEVSPSRKVTYERLAAEEASFHLSQEDFKPLADVLTKGDLQKFLRDFRAVLGNPLFPDPVRLKLGKSHVKTSVVGDIFEGVSSGSIAYVPPRGFQTQRRGDISLELGGPWAFYRDFWRAHNLDDLAQIVESRLYIRAGETLQIPLLLRNDTYETQEVILSLTSELPEGWRETRRPSRFVVEAGDVYPVQALITTPSLASPDWQEITYAIQVKGREVSRANLRIQLRSIAIPQ